MSDSPNLDIRTFRDVIGRFATGVTVVTTTDGDSAVGMTANAVSSVSLDPFLVLVCVDKLTLAHEHLNDADGFAVNILAQGQGELSTFFASTGRGEEGDAMGGFPYQLSDRGTPLLDGTIGWLDCRPWQRYDGGDHTIVVGEVRGLALTQPDVDPLLFFAGGYRQLGESI
jgi:flavin reductase (DIM6/NTAB) family NADH-FMN oxidoreductase RutF